MGWAARLIGGFYLLAGVGGLWLAVIDWRTEQVLAAVITRPRLERVGVAAVGAGSLLVAFAGLALMLLQPWAVAAFLAAWTAQAAYLGWAQICLRPATPITERGRRLAVHAFAAYSVVTVWVMAGSAFAWFG